MNKSYSKIRHIQEANEKLDKRFLSEVKTSTQYLMEQVHTSQAIEFIVPWKYGADGKTQEPAREVFTDPNYIPTLRYKEGTKNLKINPAKPPYTITKLSWQNFDNPITLVGPQAFTKGADGYYTLTDRVGNLLPAKLKFTWGVSLYKMFVGFSDGETSDMGVVFIKGKEYKPNKPTQN
jgi:hypothetical protein